MPMPRFSNEHFVTDNIITAQQIPAALCFLRRQILRPQCFYETLGDQVHTCIVGVEIFVGHIGCQVLVGNAGIDAHQSAAVFFGGFLDDLVVLHHFCRLIVGRVCFAMSHFW